MFNSPLLLDPTTLDDVDERSSAPSSSSKVRSDIIRSLHFESSIGVVQTEVGQNPEARRGLTTPTDRRLTKGSERDGEPASFGEPTGVDRRFGPVQRALTFATWPSKCMQPSFVFWRTRGSAS